MPESDYLRALFLGIVQGIAEFLPISSSGHIVVLNELLESLTGGSSNRAENYELNLALHAGTLLSILVVYRRDLVRLAKDYRLCALILVATLPLVAIGVSPLRERVETVFESALVAGFGLLATAALLVVGQRAERDGLPFGRCPTLSDLPPLRALAVGLFQTAALVPGVSRSGSTIAGGLMCGLGREPSTTFSFLIAIPAIAGAACLLGLEIREKGATGTAPGALLLGGAVAFLVGVLALRWLLRLVSQRRLHWFSWYCAAAGLATIVWQLSR